MTALEMFRWTEEKLKQVFIINYQDWEKMIFIWFWITITGLHQELQTVFLTLIVQWTQDRTTEHHCVLKAIYVNVRKIQQPVYLTCSVHYFYLMIILRAPLSVFVDFCHASYHFK